MATLVVFLAVMGCISASYHEGESARFGLFSLNRPDLDKPRYEEHEFVPYTRTQSTSIATSTVTRTHTVRITTTSDVWITSAVVVPLAVTQYETRRDFVREGAQTITSFIRVTKSPVVLETTTIQKFPVRTLVSVFTSFVTKTSTDNLLHPVTHYLTSFEVVTLPVHEKQTLVQVFTTKRLVRSTQLVTSTRGYGYGYY